jgi:cytoskeleton protein RodZ
MISVGESLRRERLRRNLELDQISRELRISHRFLEAIEAEQFDHLPAPIFAKSFVRQYARLLGLNEDELAAEIQRMTEPVEVVPPTPDEPKPVMQEIHLPKMEWEKVGEKRFRWGGPLSALAGVVAVMLACSAIYSWWQRPRRTAPQPTQSVAVQPLAQNPPAPVPESPAATEPTANPDLSTPAPTPTPASPAQATPAAPVTAGEQPAGLPAKPPVPPADSAPVALPPVDSKPFQVELTADEPVWVLAGANGKYLFSGTLEANQTRVVEASGVLLLRFGNAGGVSVTLNGKKLGTLGPKGQIRTFQFTSGGFQIVPAANPSAPADLR